MSKTEDNIGEIVGDETAIHYPEQKDWEAHKAEIIAEYAGHTLEEVRAHMRAKYKFNASKRMYHTRFRKWGVKKYMDSAQKDALALRLSQGLRSGDEITVKASDLRKLIRYINSQDKLTQRVSMEERLQQGETKPEDPTAGPSFDATEHIAMNWFDVGQRSFSFNSSPLHGTSDTSPRPQTPLSVSRRSSLDSLDAQLSCFSPNPGLTLDKANKTMEQILHIVKTYYLAKFEEWPQVDQNDSILKVGSTVESRRFWSNLKNGIYLWKLQSKFPDQYGRAFSAFDGANALAEQALSTDPVDFCLELLATLSPWNTSIYPPLRKSLLTHIRQTAAASNRLGPSHPITMLCEALLEDEDSAAISLTALFSVYGIFGEKLGYENAGSEKIATTLMKSMRRAGPQHHQDAKVFGEQRLELTRFLEGNRSVEARRTAVELANVLTRSGEYGRALALRLAVVQPMTSIHGMPLNPDDDDAWQTDDIAVHVMEDIAEYYVRIGDVEEAGLWLAGAEMYGRRLWGDCVALGHITDKMEALALGIVQGQVTDQ